MVGIICPPPVGIGLTDLPNIGGPVAPPAPPVPAPLCNNVDVVEYGGVARRIRRRSVVLFYWRSRALGRGAYGCYAAL